MTSEKSESKEIASYTFLFFFFSFPVAAWISDTSVYEGSGKTLNKVTKCATR